MQDMVWTIDHFVDGICPEAVNMTALSEKAFREGHFIDVAYSTPLYLKEFQATIPKNKVISTTDN